MQTVAIISAAIKAASSENTLTAVAAKRALEKRALIKTVPLKNKSTKIAPSKRILKKIAPSNENLIKTVPSKMALIKITP